MLFNGLLLGMIFSLVAKGPEITVQNQTVTFGSLTPALAGGAQAQASDGTYVNFVSIVGKISGDTNNWTISGGRLVSTVALAGRSGAVLRCVAAGSTCDVTIAIDPGADDVATALEFQTAFSAGDHGGQRFYFRPATSFDMTAASSMYNRLGGQSSEVIFDCRDPVNRARLNFFQLGVATSNVVQNLTFQNLHFVDTKAAMQTAKRTIMMNFGAGPYDRVMARNIKIQDCVFELDLGYGRLGDKPIANGDIYAINFRSFAENITIQRNEIINHGMGIVFGNGCRDVLVEENIFRLAWNDFMRIACSDVTDSALTYPDTDRVRVAFNAIYDPVADNEIRHVDTVQTFQNTVNGFPGTMRDIELIGNLSFLGAEGLRQPPPLYPSEQSLIHPVSTNYTVLASEFLGEGEASVRIDANTASGPVTVTLPDMNTVGNYTRLYVAKVSGDTNTVTIVDPSGVFSTVVLTNLWEKNTYTKKGSVATVLSIPGIAALREINSDCVITTNDFINGTAGATAWKVNTSNGPVTLQLPDMGATPSGLIMTVSKISADTNPVILRMSKGGQTISLKTKIDGSGETATEYRLKARWAGVYMSKATATSISMTASAPNLAGFRIQRYMYNGTNGPYAGMAVVGNLMYTTDLFYRPEAPVDNLVLAYNTGIQTHSGDVNGDGVIDIHDGYNPGSPETEWYYVTNGIRHPEAFGNISQTFGAYYLSPTNGINLNSGNLQTKAYTNNAQFEALFDVSSADNLSPKTVQQAIDLSKTKSSGPGTGLGAHELITFSTRADGRGLTGTFKDMSAPAAPTATATTNGTTATITITPNGTAAVHEYGSRIWYLVDSAASHTYNEIISQGASRYVRGAQSEIIITNLPPSGSCYLHMARRSINTQTVVSTPISLSSSSIMAPLAGFSVSPASGTAPLAVTFTDTSSESITNRYWNFGDGTTTNTTATSPGHTYSSTGTYTVVLTVSGPGGSATNTQSNVITVVAPIYVTASTADRQLTSIGGLADNTTATAGSGSPVTTTNTYVIPFQLPAISVGQTITNVQFAAFLISGYTFGSPGIQVYVDVFGGRVDVSSTVSTNDWKASTLLGDNIAQISKDYTATNMVKSAVLTASFFQDIYANDTNASGKYVFLTLRPDAASPNASAVTTWATANHATLAKPTLTFTVIGGN